MKPFGVVYLIGNMVNGKKYVGQTVQSLKKRFNNHANCKSMIIGKAIRKYGRKNFRYGVIKSCASKEELDYWEKYFIVVLHSKTPYGYNCTDGGEGAIGYSFTPEQRAKLSAMKKGKYMGEENPHYGKHHSAETKAYLSAIRLGEKNPNYGKPMPNEQRAKIKAKLKGVPKSPETRAKLSALRKGKALSVTTCIKMSAAQSGEKNHNYGKPCSPEVSSKISAKNRGNSPFQNLLKEINAHNLSYHRLAELMRIAYTSVSAKMLGRLNFTARDAAKLEEIFGKPAEYLLERQDCTERIKAQGKDSPYKNLLNELDAHNLSYRRLAELLDVSHTSVARKMRGERNFTARDAAKLEEIFGKGAEYLLERTEP